MPIINLTPKLLAIRTHTAEPVPYLYDSQNQKSGVPVFTEDTAKSTENVVEEGFRLIERMIK